MPKNIVLITEQFYPRTGGMELATYHLARALNQLKEFNTVVSCSALSEVPKKYHYPFPVERAKKASFLTSWLYNRNLHKLINKYKIDILHGQTLHGGGSKAMKMSERTGIPFVVTSHGSDVQVVQEINYGAQLLPEMKEQMMKVLEKTHAIIAVSQLNKQHLIELGANHKKITVIPNGIQYQEIKALPNGNLRKELGFTNENFVIISVGRNRPIKRLNLIFEAIQIAKNTKIKCICVGPKENITALIQKYNIEKQVICKENIPSNRLLLHPPYTELIQLYNAADIYVSTSYVESFGMAAADALACGIPIIVGKNHGIKDVIEEGINGFSLKEDSAKELAELLNHLYTKKIELNSKKDIISDSVKHLDWSLIAEETTKVYLDVIQRTQFIN